MEDSEKDLPVGIIARLELVQPTVVRIQGHEATVTKMPVFWPHNLLVWFRLSTTRPEPEGVFGDIKQREKAYRAKNELAHPLRPQLKDVADVRLDRLRVILNDVGIVKLGLEVQKRWAVNCHEFQHIGRGTAEKRHA
jgi:hypothetical protein